MTFMNRGLGPEVLLQQPSQEEVSSAAHVPTPALATIFNSEIEYKLSVLSYKAHAARFDNKLNALQHIVESLTRRLESLGEHSVHVQKSLVPVEVVVQVISDESKATSASAFSTKLASAFDLRGSGEGVQSENSSSVSSKQLKSLNVGQSKKISKWLLAANCGHCFYYSVYSIVRCIRIQ